jgi:RNA polymerase sigma-70 factor (ECF subfamily)
MKPGSSTAGEVLEPAVTIPSSSDSDRIARFCDGNREAFTELYRMHSPAIFRFALHMTGDRLKAAEITQDVFVWLIHHPRDFQPGRGALGSFLAGVARQFLRRQKRNERRWLSFEDAAPQHAGEAVDPGRAIDAETLRKAIARLPLQYREAVVLCDLEGYSYEAAAGLLDCAIGTIRSRLHRGRELLARKFQPKIQIRRTQV